MSAWAKAAAATSSGTYSLTNVMRSACGLAAMRRAGSVQFSQVSPTTVSQNRSASWLGRPLKTRIRSSSPF